MYGGQMETGKRPRIIGSQLNFQVYRIFLKILFRYSKIFIYIAWLFNESPTKDYVVTNDRWGQGTGRKHGSFFSGPDRWQPGHLVDHKWENAMTIDQKSWTIRRNMELTDILSPEDIISEIVITVSCGGNILINVGPTKVIQF